MIYANADFYQNEYLQGRAGIIPLTEFPHWSMKASAKINFRSYTRNEIEDALANVNPESAYRFRLAICEIAEAIYADNALSGASASGSDGGVVGPKSSESVGEYSVSYNTSAASMTEVDRTAQLSAKARSAANSWLFGTDLHNMFVYLGG